MKFLSYTEGDSFVSKELSTVNQLISDAKKELDYFKETNTSSFGIQATEKLWGVLAHIIRLNQYLMGYQLPKSHNDNLVYMKNLVSQKEIGELRKRANLMHKRFYTGEFSIEVLERDYNYVLRKKNDFINKIKMI